MGGNVVDSINIPLNEIPERVEELKVECTFDTLLRLWKQKWTGTALLSELGIECYNGGSWLDVIIIYHKQQNKMINTLKNLFGLGPKVDYADFKTRSDHTRCT
jgi:hypothetical protein